VDPRKKLHKNSDKNDYLKIFCSKFSSKKGLFPGITRTMLDRNVEEEQ
jgi:hypothetical protein